MLLFPLSLINYKSHVSSYDCDYLLGLYSKFNLYVTKILFNLFYRETNLSELFSYIMYRKCYNVIDAPDLLKRYFKLTRVNFRPCNQRCSVLPNLIEIIMPTIRQNIGDEI
jgi:hypothetical protein